MSYSRIFWAVYLETINVSYHVQLLLSEQGRIHGWTVACDWAGAVIPEHHTKKINQTLLRTEQRTDRQTDEAGYRVACTRLQIYKTRITFSVYFTTNRTCEHFLFFNVAIEDVAESESGRESHCAICYTTSDLMEATKRWLSIIYCWFKLGDLSKEFHYFLWSCLVSIGNLKGVIFLLTLYMCI